TSPGPPEYNVSKYGVIGLTEALAVEGKRTGISAICVSPGAVDTEMLRRANPELRPGLTPEQVADLIVALLDGPLIAASGANIPLFSNAYRACRPHSSDASSTSSPARSSLRGRVRAATSRAQVAISPSVSSSGSPPRLRPMAARSWPWCT